MGKAPELCQLDPDTQFDIVEHCIEPRQGALPHLIEHGGELIQPLEAHASNKKIGLDVIKRIEQRLPAPHGFLLAFEWTADGLQRQYGIKPRHARNGRSLRRMRGATRTSGNKINAGA